MRTRTWLAGLTAGTLMLGGIVVADPSVEAASIVNAAMQQDGTPAAEDGDTEGNGTPVIGTPLLAPAIDLVQAQEAALTGNEGAAVASVELTGDDGILVYEVKLDNGTEVEVDATSGEVLKTEQAGDEQADDEDEDDDEESDDDEGEDDQGDDEGENEDN